MRQQMSLRDHPITVSRLVPKLIGPAEEAITRTHADLSVYATQNGVYEFPSWLSKAIGVDHASEENKMFEAYSPPYADKSTRT